MEVSEQAQPMAEDEGVNGDDGPRLGTASIREQLSDSDGDDSSEEDIPRALGPHPIPMRPLPGAAAPKLDRSDSKTLSDDGTDDSDFDDAFNVFDVVATRRKHSTLLLRKRLASRASIAPPPSNSLNDLVRHHEDQLVVANESSPRGPSQVSPEPLSNKGHRRSSVSMKMALDDVEVSKSVKKKKRGFLRFIATLPSMKARLKKYLATSFVGLGLEVINVFLSLISCGMYVVETYPGQGSNELAEILLSMFFLFDYVLRVYLADNRVQTVLSPVMVIDMLTILPVLFSGPGLGFDRSTVGFMGVFRMMKVLRLLRLQRVMAYFDDVLMSQIFKLVLTIVFIIFFASGVFNYIENTRNAIEKRTSPDDLAEGLLASELLFHECAWFIVVTVTTVRVFSHPRACRRWRNVP